MNTRVLTLDMLAKHMRRQVEDSQSRLDLRYRQKMKHVLESVQMPGMAVVMEVQNGRSRTHDASARFFSTSSWGRPVVEELTLELTMVIETDIPPERTWWHRVSRFWQRCPAVRRRLVRISYAGSRDEEGIITVDGHTIRRFPIKRDRPC